MTRRHLNISPSLASLLHQSQIDAIELAGLDCDFNFSTFIPEEYPSNAVIDPSEVKLFLCSTSDYERLREHPDTYSPADIILIHSGQNEEIRSGLASYGGPRFTVGASAPSILRGVIGSILEFRIGLGCRGILPRLTNIARFESIERQLTTSTQRAIVQQDVQDFCKEALQKHREITAQGTRQYAKSVSDILDELLMNAIWDADPNFTGSDRRRGVDLDPSRTVTVECACDGSNLCLTVEDKLGTFPFSALTGPLAFALGLKPDIQVRNGPGGAGLGLFMVMQKTSILTFEVNPGRCTRVSTLLRLDEPVRVMQSKPKSVLVFESSPLRPSRTENSSSLQ